ncbi:MAG TPA: hypothetical protein VKC60_07085, partial [Opitutaceae bacterium]|nr:hypothetical protein [Opitutaceae bacterium]
WPVLAAWYAKGSRWHAFVAGCFGAALALIGLGAANFAISGEWRMTPWQGAYNAWAANGPQSNGRFFTQTVRVNFENGFDNPARLESIRLYQSETGVNPPFGIDAMNHYWTAKTVRYVTAHPFAWFRLLMRKVYSLIHNHEQYDNKTYAFEKSFAPWLKWDPLNWGLLSAIATGSFLALRPRTSSGPALLFWFIFVYAAGVVLFHTNNRFRVPLIPALAAIASGVVVWIRELGPALWRKIAVIGIVAALIFPPWFNVAGSDTRAQDCILYSGASLTIGRDAEAKLWAERGLALRPDRDDLREMIILAEFNLFATDLTAKLTRTTAVERLETCLRLKEPEFETRYVAGMYAWKLSRREDALRLWKSATNGDLATIHAGAMTALLLHFSTEPGVREIANQIPLQKRSAQLHVAMADYGDAASASWLSNHLSSEAQTQLRASLDHLFLPLADGSVKKP